MQQMSGNKEDNKKTPTAVPAAASCAWTTNGRATTISKAMKFDNNGILQEQQQGQND